MATSDQKNYVSSIIFSDRSFTLDLLKNIYVLCCILTSLFVFYRRKLLALLAITLFISAYSFLLGLANINADWIRSAFLGTYSRIFLTILYLLFLFSFVSISLIYYSNSFIHLSNFEFKQFVFVFIAASTIPALIVRLFMIVPILNEIFFEGQYSYSSELSYIAMIVLIVFLFFYISIFLFIAIAIISILVTRFLVGLPLRIIEISKHTHAPNQPFTFIATITSIFYLIIISLFNILT